jgi:hypothetical protein
MLFPEGKAAGAWILLPTLIERRGKKEWWGGGVSTSTSALELDSLLCVEFYLCVHVQKLIHRLINTT